jgi:cell division septation protein DedD
MFWWRSSDRDLIFRIQWRNPCPKNLTVNPIPLSNRSGFVLQVGAMTHKENAEALAEALQRRNFPAFVSRREADGFYRVVVGPCTDVDSTL